MLYAMIRDDALIHSINMLLQYVAADQRSFNAGFDYVDDTEDIPSQGYLRENLRGYGAKPALPNDDR